MTVAASLPRESLDRDPRWLAIQRRDVSADDTFVYSVATTGIYCRPSCGARRPNPKNVAIHASAVEAERAGFRPCRRCRPNEPKLKERQAALVTDLCRHIEDEQELPTISDLAKRAGLSVSRLQRIFREVTGLSPKAYLSGRRAERLRAQLGSANSVTEAAYRAGYGSSARFYDSVGERLGMKPNVYRKGAPGEKIRFAIGETSLGAVLVAASSKGVCAVFLGDDPQLLVQDLEKRFSLASLVADDSDFDGWVARVVGLVEYSGERPPEETFPLDLRGTIFQMRVWDALSKIPFGSTTTYTKIAEAIGQPRAVRAVAGACGSNPVSVVIPCHRVVRQDGSLSGYRWGVERKRQLLGREADWVREHSSDRDGSSFGSNEGGSSGPSRT